MSDFYQVLGVSKRASKEEINDAFRKLAVECHPDRNKDDGATARFAEASEAYSVLSDNWKRRLYDTLGPEKYDDPHEVLFYRLNQEAANREMEREYNARTSAMQYNARTSAMQYDAAYSTGILVFFLLLLDFFIPSWVLGPWFFVFNAFLILGIAVGVRDSFK